MNKFKKIYKELLENPEKKIVFDFCEHIRQELCSGHIAYLSACFKNITDALTELNPDTSTLDQLFGLDLHLIFPEVYSASLEQGVVCIPDAVDLLLSLTGFLNALCENTLTGKTKLFEMLPVLIQAIIILSDKRTTLPLRLDILKLTNLILEDLDQPKEHPNFTVEEIENRMEDMLVSAGDFEFQAAFVELVFRLIPCDIRQAKAKEYFRFDSVSQAFSDILNEEFEAGCRNFINTLNQNHQSVMPLPCYSATFGTSEVHKPVDSGINDFWVDFNFGSQCISLVIQETPHSQDNEKEGGGSWEIVVIKVDNVEDYRLAEIKNDEVALLLKLNVPAADLVCFLPRNPSQYIKISFNVDYTSSLTDALAKIFGRPAKRVQNSGGESDTSSTPNKASVAINPVRIRSKKTEVTHVMPTASIILQLSESATDHEEENVQLQKKPSGRISGDNEKPERNSTENRPVNDVMSDSDEAEHEAGDTLRADHSVNGDESLKGPNQDDSLAGSEDENNDAWKQRLEQTVRRDESEKRPKQAESLAANEEENKGTETTERKKPFTVPVKRISERIRSRDNLQSVQHSSEEDNKKDRMRRKSLPSAFNVSGRLAASKQKTMPTKTLSEAAKSRRAIREKVFAKARRSPTRIQKVMEVKYGNSKLHMMSPARLREPRSGDASGNDNEDIREKCADVIQDSLPIADSTEDESGPKHQEMTGGNKGSLVKEDNSRATRQRINVDIALASKNSKAANTPTGKLPEGRNAESKRIPTKKRPTRMERKQKDTLPMAQAQDTESGDQNEPALSDIKRRTRDQRRSQGVKRKYQKQKETRHLVVVDSDSNSEDNTKLRNEKVSREVNKNSTSKRSSQRKQKDLPKDEAEASISEIDDKNEDHNELVWRGDSGSDEVTECYGETECYVEDASPLINSSPVAQTVSRRRRQSLLSGDSPTGDVGLCISAKKPVSKKKRPLTKADIVMMRSFTTPLSTREIELQMEGSPQAQPSDVESVSSEEEDIPLKRAKIAPNLKTPTELSQQTDFSYTTEQRDDKEDDTGEESDSVHSDPELEYDFNLDSKPYGKTSHKKQGKSLTGPGSGGSNAAKRSMILHDSGIGETPFGEERHKRSKQPRKRIRKPLQVSVAKTPVTPKSDQEEPAEDDSANAETDEESISPDLKPAMTGMLRGKRKLFDWSTSGPSTTRAPTGTRTSRTEGWYAETVHVRSQHFGKPRKLSYDEEPYDVDETDEVVTERSGDFRRDIQSLISLAGGKVTQANRKAGQIIKSYALRVNELMSSTIDTFWNEQQAASYSAIKKYKRQLVDQIKGLETDLDKTASTVREMESTFLKHCKVLKNQRQVEEKRFRRIQQLQELMEAELTMIEQKRNKEKATLQAELEKETARFQKKFLQETRKQKEDQLKMILNIMRIP